MSVPESYEEYLSELNKNLSWLERATDAASSLDERLDVNNKLQIEIVKLLREGLKLEIPVSPSPFPDLEPYSVLNFYLDTAREAPGVEVPIPGDAITIFTDGTLQGCFMRMDKPTNDAIPINEFNPYRYPAQFKKFYLTTTAQTGKYMRIHVGREAGADAAVQVTAAAPRASFYRIESDKDVNFTGAIVQYAKEDENITGLVTDKLRIVGLSLQSMQSLYYRILFWRTDGFDDTDLDVDSFCGEVAIDLPSYGFQIASANQYYLDVRGVDIDYEDSDGTHELHVSLMNTSATSKTASTAGAVKLEIFYEPRS